MSNDIDLTREEIIRALFSLQKQGIIDYTLSEPSVYININPNISNRIAVNNMTFTNKALILFDNIDTYHQLIMDLSLQILSTTHHIGNKINYIHISKIKYFLMFFFFP
jgi:hypothetical protein